MTDTTTVELQARIAELEERLKDLEARDRERRRGGDLLSDLFPPDVRGHLRAAQREQLMALRSYLDRWIAKTEERETPRGRESISVD